MIGAAAAYMTGLFFASFFTGIGSVLLFLALICIVILLGRYRGLERTDYIMLSVFFAAAFFVSSLYTSLYYDRIIKYSGSKGDFTGTITEIRRHDNERSTFVVKGRINGKQAARISYYGIDYGAKIGDRISICDCEFSEITSDYLFDSKAYNRANRIFLSVQTPEKVTVTHMDSCKIKNAVAAYRERIISEFHEKLGSGAGDFLAGMVFGIKNGLDDSSKTSLYRCGIGHILAVSGLHVSIIAFALYTFLKRLRINRIAALFIVYGVMTAFIIMANAPYSAVRAGIMTAIMLAARPLRRINDTFNSLALAVFLICLNNPYVIYSSGFILSVAGTFGIGVFGSYMTVKMPSSNFLYKTIKNLSLMLCTTLFVMPFSMKYFGETSLISPVSNLLLIPMCSLCTVIGVIYVFTGGYVDLLFAADFFTRFILDVSDRISKHGEFCLSGSSKAVNTAFFCMAFSFLAFIIFRNRKTLSIAMTVSSCAVFAASAISITEFNKEFRVAVLGKSGKAAVVISYNGITDIIDLSGNVSVPEYVKRYISENNIDCANTLVLTHNTVRQAIEYDSQLRYAGIKNIADIPDDKGFTIDDERYSVTYRDQSLIIEYEGHKITFVKVSDKNDIGSGLVVCYGTITKYTSLRSGRNVVYLDEKVAGGSNNIEITFGDNDSYTIRRL